MKMRTRSKWIFFDLGWTLIDETAAHAARFRVARKTLADQGIHISEAGFTDLCEKASAQFAPSPFRKAIQYLSIDEDLRQKVIAEAKYDHSGERLYPQVQTVLRALAQEYRLGVIANQSAGTEDRLLRYGIRNWFSLVFASTELGLTKPDPRIFSLAIESAGCVPQHAIMVGDRLDNDLGPAKQAGWKTIRVLQGFARLQAPRSSFEEADCTIESISELPILIREKMKLTSQ